MSSMSKSRLHAGPTTRARTSRDTGWLEAKMTASRNLRLSAAISAAAATALPPCGQLLRGRADLLERVVAT
jgi:hypothetical protein